MPEQMMIGAKDLVLELFAKSNTSNHVERGETILWLVKTWDGARIPAPRHTRCRCGRKRLAVLRWSDVRSVCNCPI